MAFLVIFLSFCLFFALYSAWRLFAGLKGKPRLKFFGWLTIILLWLSFPLPILLRRAGFDNAFIDILALIIYTTIGFLALVLSLLIFRDYFLIFRFIGKKITKFFKKPAVLVKDQPDNQRRQFIFNSVNGGILACSGTLTALGAFEAFRLPRIKEVSVAIKDLPPDLVGFKIVQLTDLHIAYSDQTKWLKDVVKMTNDLAPDLIAITGDLADRPAPDLTKEVASLAKLQAKHGCYFVTGNHEYYTGVEGWIKYLQELGLNVLINQHQIIQQKEARLLVAGVSDYGAGKRFANHYSSPKAATRGAKRADAKILLAHQPKNIFQAQKAGFDLQLSGHTHGGQFYPFNLMVALAQPYVSGLHNHQGTQIYVSCGTGYWGPPLRLGPTSEITLIKLVSNSRRKAANKRLI